VPQITPPVTAYGPAELWYWNGTPLNSTYWNIATLGGSRFGLPTLRGSNYAVPFRAGQAQRAKYPDSRTITLQMWTDGMASSAMPYPAGDARLAFNNNLQSIRQLFWNRNAGGSVQGQLQRNWFLTQSGSNKLVTATSMAEIAGSMDLTMNGRTNAAFSVDLLLSDPYFYGAQQVGNATGMGGTTLTTLGEGIVGEGFPSAVSAFTVAVSAACTVTNSTAGVSFTVASGPSFPVTVDILNYTVTDHVGVNQVAALTHSGSRSWMVLLPGANIITVSAGTATFTWNDVYL
jgi:hypothetical protein